MEKGKKDSVNLTQKTMDVFEFMSVERRSLSLQSIAAGVNVPAATAHRILTALKASGYVDQHENKEYFLTYKMFTVSGRIMERDRLIDEMLPYLNYFSMTTDCGMSLTAFSQGSCVSLVSVGRNIKFRAPLVVPGTAHPCHCTAAGKLFLSCLSEDEFAEWLSNNYLFPYTKSTIIDPEVLRREITETKEKGYGTMIGEFTDELAVLAIPVQYHKGKIVTAINFSIETKRFDEIRNPGFIKKARDMLSGKIQNR